MLVVSQGSGLLPLLASRAGAGRVDAVERSRMLFRMAKQALAGNPMWADVVHLLTCPLSQVCIAGGCPAGSCLVAGCSKQLRPPLPEP